MPGGRYSKLFGFAKQLGMDKEMLSEGAAQWTGKPSLRSLSDHQLRDYERKLTRRIRIDFRKRQQKFHIAVLGKHKPNATHHAAIVADLAAQVFSSVDQFDRWLKHFRHMELQDLREIDDLSKTIRALHQMKNRGYRV